jgi:transcription initiation factor TFIIB
LARLRREQSRAAFQSTAQRNLAYTCSEIARIVSALGLSRGVREQASSLFRTAQSDGLLVGRSIEGVAAACVFAVCWLTGVTRTFAEITTVAQRSQRKVQTMYRVLNRKLELPVPPRRSQEFVLGIASAVALPAETERLAGQIAKQANESELGGGMHPAGFAVVCLEVAADE